MPSRLSIRMISKCIILLFSNYGPEKLAVFELSSISTKIKDFKNLKSIFENKSLWRSFEQNMKKLEFSQVAGLSSFLQKLTLSNDNELFRLLFRTDANL